WIEGREVVYATGALRARPGTDVSSLPELEQTLDSGAFATAATQPSTLDGRPGFFLAQAGRFGTDRGFVVVFVPQGRLTVGLQDDPRRVAIAIDGRPLEGRLDGPTAARSGFEALARRWTVSVEAEPASGLDAILPWLALAWPAAVAAIVYALLHGVL